MATLVATNGSALELPLRSGINTIGRSPGNHHVLSHPSVSGRHCELILGDTSVAVRDLGSTNGTFIDDAPVTDGTLAQGQRLKVGELEFVLEAPEVVAPHSGRLRVSAISKPVAVATSASMAPPKPQTAAEVIAAIQPVFHKPPNFYRSIPGAFTYPFERNGIILLVLGAIVFTILGFLSAFSGVIAMITSGYLFAYMQKIIASTAQGEDEMPDFPEFGDWWSDVILPFLLFAATFLAALAPVVVTYFGFRESLDPPAMTVALGIAGVVGAIYLPMALLAVAVSDSFVALSPHIVVPSIYRIFLPYLICLPVLGVLVALRIGAEFAKELIPIPVLPSVAVGFLSVYLLVVEMRVLGLLFRSYGHRLGWLR